MSVDGGDIDDARLIVRLRDGDPAALEALLGRYWPLVVAYLERMTGSPDAAEDLAQETFVRLWERRERWKTRGSVRALLLRLARNQAVSRHRSEAARRKADERGAEGRPPPPTPVQVLEEETLADALDRAVGTLPPRRREVFVLRCVHGLPYAEIARIMGTSVQTVANQLSRALTHLRGELGPGLDP